MAILFDEITGGGPAVVHAGLPPGALARAIAEAAQSEAWAGRTIVVVTPTGDDAESMVDDIRFWAGAQDSDLPLDLLAERAILFASRPESPYADVAPSRSPVERGLAIAFALTQGFPLAPIVIPVDAWCRRMLGRDALVALSDIVMVGEKIDREKFVARLIEGGYARVPLVEDPGTFAVRGHVIDVFVPFYRYPLRIEVDFDRVEAIRLFRADAQRTVAPLEEALIHPVRNECYRAGAKVDIAARLRELAAHRDVSSRALRSALEAIEREVHFFGCEAVFPAFEPSAATPSSFLPPDAILIFADAAEITRRAEEQTRDEARRHQRSLDAGALSYPPESYFAPVDWSTGIRVERLPIDGATDHAITPNGAEVRVRDHSLTHVAEAIDDARRDGFDVKIVARRDNGLDRLRALLPNHELVSFERGPAVHGFRDVATKTWVLTEFEILGKRPRHGGPTTASPSRAAIEFRDLAPGALVLHADHGVARYHGLRTLTVAGTTSEFLHLEFAANDKLYLPVLRLDRLQKHPGGDAEPRLDKLGGERFAETKKRVRRDLLAMAKELVATHAARTVKPGFAFSAPDPLFREFEGRFPYTETPDQARAIDETLADMQRAEPMDRLVCGDVGFGKTEVAMRAAMKAVLDGRQVAVLVPTTVLAIQHEQTFRERFATYPVRLASLSRLQSAAESAAILADVANGKIDIVIGTHRLLSNDVAFRALGLVVVDEEHRFGVAHKEKLKKLRAETDFLTLTATPIPRTLQMSLTGLRDLSIITTAPEDRLAVRTVVSRFDPATVSETIRAEIQRGGQVFFVHNRVQGLKQLADYIQTLVPEAKITVAHGQLPERALEEAMLTFTRGGTNILVSTTIIESGLDIPRANLMFINRADTFGLAQLHQLRGRVGRSRERAYCTLIVPGRVLTREAEERLRVLQDFSDLGSGYAIATHDLEIRGAGNLLGAEQHGAITQIGFELYAEMLAEAVAEIQGQPNPTIAPCEVRHTLEAVLPVAYIEDASVRLQLYKRLASAATVDEIDAIADEIADRFGRAPEAVRALTALARAKVAASRLGATLLEVGADSLSFTFGSHARISATRVVGLVSRPNSVYRLLPDGRLTRALNKADARDLATTLGRVLAELDLVAER